MTELTACLALCGGIGMTEDNRREWLLAARLTLDGIPGDLLSYGCQKARETCDHPSKIIPAIMADAKEMWDSRRRNAPVGSLSLLPPPAEPAPQYCSPEEASAIIKEFGLRSQSTR